MILLRNPIFCDFSGEGGPDPLSPSPLNPRMILADFKILLSKRKQNVLPHWHQYGINWVYAMKEMALVCVCYVHMSIFYMFITPN